MDIYINNEKLDFQLENEKQLSQVINSVADWIMQGNHFLDYILIDDQKISLKDAQETNKDVDDVKEVKFFIKGHLDQIEEIVPVLNQYIHRFSEEIKKGQEVFCINKKEKLEGIIWIADSLSLITQNLGISPRYIFFEGRNLDEVLNFFHISIQTLNDYIHDSGFFYNYFSEGVQDKFPIIESMVKRLVQLYNFMLGGEEDLFVENLLFEAVFIKNIMNEVSGLLQDGRDQDALSMIQKLMAFFEFLSIAISKMKLSDAEKTEVEGYQSEIIELLNETYEGFKTGDIISVSDIVEYELSEKLDLLIHIFENRYSNA